MQAPKRKTSKSKRNMRRSHHALKTTQPTSCQQCGASVAPHTVCAECGYYRGRQLLGVAE